MSDSTTPPLAHRIRQALPLLAAAIFLILGFAAHAWAWSWIVFVLVPIGYVLLPRPPEHTRSEKRL